MWIQCLITVLGQFFKSFYTTKKTPKHSDVEKKKHLQHSDYGLLQPNEQTFVLSTPPLWTPVLVTAEPFEISLCATFLCHTVTCACDTHQTWVELLRGHPASLPVWGAHNFLMRHLGFIKPAEKHLCVSSSACHKMPRDWFKEGKRRAGAAISETLVEWKATLTRKGALKTDKAFFFKNKILWKWLQALNTSNFVFSEKIWRLEAHIKEKSATKMYFYDRFPN